jgi:hypothetical protein
MVNGSPTNPSTVALLPTWPHQANKQANNQTNKQANESSKQSNQSINESTYQPISQREAGL